MNKAAVPGPDGSFVGGWTCGWCPAGKGDFKGDNETKALAHVAKIPGKNIRLCEGNIPKEKLLQYSFPLLDEVINKVGQERPQ